jgi:2-oxo-4-hydroxy-4-carboxy-5-ureidoimidazoline decarboxylase
MTRTEFVTRYGGIYEHSPWVAEAAFGRTGDLAEIMSAVVDAAGADAQLGLLRAHPDLAGKLAMTASSVSEQSGAGLDQCSPEEFAEFTALNDRYKSRFGFPFILAVRGLHRGEILENFRRRIGNDRDTEFTTAIAEVHKIAGFRLQQTS